MASKPEPPTTARMRKDIADAIEARAKARTKLEEREAEKACAKLVASDAASSILLIPADTVPKGSRVGEIHAALTSDGFRGNGVELAAWLLASDAAPYVGHKISPGRRAGELVARRVLVLATPARAAPEPALSKDVAFVGLGIMGYPMAGHLAAAGHRVCVYNRTAAKAQAWLGDHAGRSAPTPAEAASGADMVFLCVGNDQDVRSVVYGDDGVLAGASQDAIVVDHTTASASLARELSAEAAAQGIGFLDAPVSGGQAGAENGQLSVMVGGKGDVFARAQPVIDCYAKTVKLMGDVGAGQLTKMVNQVCIAGILQGLAEGLHFAEKAGLDLEAVVEVISQGAAQSWQMDNRAETMAERKFEFGFAVNWMRKDLDMTLAAARELDARMPLAALVDQFYADVQAFGGGRWDTSSLIERLRRVDEA